MGTEYGHGHRGLGESAVPVLVPVSVPVVVVVAAVAALSRSSAVVGT